MGDIRRTTGEDIPLTKQESHDRNVKICVTLLSILAIILAVGMLVKVERSTLASGFVTCDQYAEVRVSKTAQVKEILVKDAAIVQAGDILVKLDDSAEQLALAEAQAHLGDVQRAMEGHKQTIAALQIQQESLRQSLLEKKESSSLLIKQQARVSEMMESLKKVTQQLENSIHSWEKVVAQAEQNLEGRVLKAPISGKVLKYEFCEGEVLSPDTVAYEIFGSDVNQLKVRINENAAAIVKCDQPYKAKLYAYRGLRAPVFTGKVLSMRDSIQRNGNISYRVAFCDFDANGYDIQPGTTADVRIFYGKSCLWFYLFNVNL